MRAGLRISEIYKSRIAGIGRHWDDAQVDGRIEAGVWWLQTRNVHAFNISPSPNFAGGDPTQLPIHQGIFIDGTRIAWPGRFSRIVNDGGWKPAGSDDGLRKRPGLQGPIDDAFMSPFLVVTPSGTCRHPLVERWVRFELAHFEKRWREVFRGRLRMKGDIDVTPGGCGALQSHFMGRRCSNKLIAKFADQLPIKSDDETIRVGDRTFPADRHVASFIYPLLKIDAKPPTDERTLRCIRPHQLRRHQQWPDVPRGT